MNTESTTRVGTCGWEYRHWRRAFYPEALSSNGWLGHYAKEFSVVEVNSSFYELPSQEIIAGWCRLTPEDFRFAVQAPRQLTYQKKLKHCENELQIFLTRLNVFGNRLGPVLFRLPDGWRCNVRRLSDFLDMLPNTRRYVFEFPDPSWHCDAVFQVLAGHGATALMSHSHRLLPASEPLTDFAYIRLDNTKEADTGSFSAHELRGWSARAAALNRGGTEVYLILANDQRAYSIRNARRVDGFLREGAAHPGEVLIEQSGR
jgi:uncharacterized protein YecE (DUF72 family)